jgi:outer membrane protein assembly factor BamB
MRNQRQSLKCAIVVLALSSVPPSLAAESWSAFRGPTADGQVATGVLATTWSESRVTWRTPIAGKAWSSPIVVADSVWMTSATEDGKRLSAVRVDIESGNIDHDITVFEIDEPMFCISYNSYASSTPVAEEGRVYVHFGSAGTACLDAGSGKTLWQRQDLLCDHHRGPGSSPILHKDLLIVHFDGSDVQYVVALDKKTGKTVWKVDREIDYGTDNGDAKKAYGTPTVIQHNGREQLISPAAVATTSYDPNTGKQLWRVYHGGFNAAARPLYSHGLVILNLEGGMRMLAVRPDGEGDVTKTHIEWKYGKSTPTRPSQLVVGDHLYMISDKGIFTCLEIQTGTPKYVERIGGAHSASPVVADGKIYCFDEKGEAFVINANPEKYDLVAKNQLESGCMASPAVAGNALIVRTKSHIYRIDPEQVAGKK